MNHISYQEIHLMKSEEPFLERLRLMEEAVNEGVITQEDHFKTLGPFYIPLKKR